jgi:hypothetical protein
LDHKFLETYLNINGTITELTKAEATQESQLIKKPYSQNRRSPIFIYIYGDVESMHALRINSIYILLAHNFFFFCCTWIITIYKLGRLFRPIYIHASTCDLCTIKKKKSQVLLKSTQKAIMADAIFYINIA